MATETKPLTSVEEVERRVIGILIQTLDELTKLFPDEADRIIASSIASAQNDEIVAQLNQLATKVASRRPGIQTVRASDLVVRVAID